MPDEGLHEIQLNGKQLVFLFMTATVVAVVIFLCGVMVGRGVPTQRGTPVLATEGADPTTNEEARAAAPSDTAATPAAASNPSASPSSKLGLTYTNRLEQPEPVVEDLTAASPGKEPFARTAVATAPPPVVKTPAPSAKPDKPEKVDKPRASNTAASRPAATEAVAKAPKADDQPGGAGFVVQVAATHQRGEADAIRGRLTKKGYPAFVTTAGPSAAPTYRVRVGKYTSRREADSVAGKLEREEQFKPWVTR